VSKDVVHCLTTAFIRRAAALSVASVTRQRALELQIHNTGSLSLSLGKGLYFFCPFHRIERGVVYAIQFAFHCVNATGHKSLGIA
jgi:hypothetical protein